MSSLSRFLQEEIEKGSFPGGAALVGSADAVLLEEYAGEAVVEPERRPVTSETRFDLASLTKPLGAAAIVAAAKDLDVGSAPGRYLSGWKKTRFDGITLERLLTHTSGLPAWLPLYVWGEGAAAYRRRLSELEPESKPGAAVIYSDLNFLVLGEVLETHFAAPLDLLFEELVRRSGGSGAGFLPPNARETAATERGDSTEREMTAALGLSYPHFRTDVVWGDVHDGNAYRRGGIAAHAGLFGTARDVWSLARPWLAERRPDFVRDHTPELPEARGLAWQLRRGAGSAVPAMSGSSFGHTGFTGTSVWIDPEADRIWVLLTNRIHPEAKPGDFNEVRRRFHEIALELG